MHTFTHNTMSSLLHLQGAIIYKVTEIKESFVEPKLLISNHTN